ncbi:uncharacterized protein LOC114576132 [Exaiptasia diaphana]|uniref:MAM domain-containing protein n=1 Tax=Exaiptasia diaphana TaxID=2652724 RepID=A0A913YVJ0_EXADI|nr:uncharacterized protein LOC114576132 [Exaiptasia diaphana]
MMFRYQMYGGGVDTVAAIVTRSNNSIKEAVWFKYGDQSNNLWRNVCLALEYDGDYKVSFEAVFSSNKTTDNWSIALGSLLLDDYVSVCKTNHSFHNISYLDPARSEISTANCSFKGTSCGWRTAVNLMVQDGLLWKTRNKKADFKGITDPNLPSYIHTSAGNESSENKTKAILISPRLLGPSCMTLTYSMSNATSKLAIVLLKKRNPFVFLKLWETNNTGKAVKKIKISLTYDKPFQVLVIGYPSPEQEDIILYNVLFLSGRCYDGYTTGQDESGLRSNVIYVKSSFTNAQIASPWMTGQQCMNFFYRISDGPFADYTSYIAVFIHIMARSDLKPLWVKSHNGVHKWNNAEIFYSNTKLFQFIIEMRSENASSTAIDDITFSQAPCSHHGEIVTYYLKKNAVKQEYKIERHPLVYNGYSMVMEFQIERSLNNLSSGLHCVNPKPSHRKEIVSKEKDLWKDKYNLPMDCFFLNTSANVKRLYAFYDADFEKQVEYTLTNASCQCHPKVKTFAIKNARIPGNYEFTFKHNKVICEYTKDSQKAFEKLPAVFIYCGTMAVLKCTVVVPSTRQLSNYEL